MNIQPNDSPTRRPQHHADQFCAAIVLGLLFTVLAITSGFLHAQGDGGPFNIYLGGTLAVVAFVYAVWRLHMHVKQVREARETLKIDFPGTNP